MHKKKEIIMPLLVFIALLVLWEGAVYIWGISLYVLPSPSSMMMALFENIEVLFQHALVTLSEALLGLCIAVVLAMLIGIAMDISKTFKNSIFPHLVVTQTVPVMVLAPLFSIWLGFGMAPKVWMVIFMCFFPIVISFADGMAQVDTHQINLLQSYHAKRWQIYALVKIPAAALSLFSGLKVAATYCVGGAIVGEWISSGAGLGYYMLRVKNGYMLDKVFACVLVVIVISLLLHGIVRLIERACCPHRVNKNKRRVKNEKALVK